MPRAARRSRVVSSPPNLPPTQDAKRKGIPCRWSREERVKKGPTPTLTLGPCPCPTQSPLPYHKKFTAPGRTPNPPTHRLLAEPHPLLHLLARAYQAPATYQTMPYGSTPSIKPGRMGVEQKAMQDNMPASFSQKHAHAQRLAR